MTEGRDYAGLSLQYQAGVLDGSIPACSWVRLACERNRKDLGRQGSEGFPYRFDAEVGSRICAMAEMLPHIKGPLAYITGTDDEGRNLWNTITVEPWQCWILTTLFGWVHVETGLRRFRVALILIPRKNAKSTLGAVIALYMLTADGESGAECYSAATTRDQAKVVAEIAWEMARRSHGFRDYFGVKMGAKTTRVLEVPETASRFTPLSAEANSLDGLNVSVAVVDELHAHRQRGVWDVLDTATGARPQPLLCGITTAGVETGGICYEKLTYLHKVLDGAAEDPTFFGINYTVDPEDDWRDPVAHRKANPNYGVSVRPDDLTRKVMEAEHSQAAINNFQTKHLNIWVRSESSWMPTSLWDSCAVPGLSLDALRKFPCRIGVDLAEVRDIAATYALFDMGAGMYGAIGRFYLPKATIQKSPVAQMSGWVRQGYIIETDGDQADFQRIEDDLMDWCNTLNVIEIDFDRALASQMQQSLKRRLEPKLGRDGVDAFVLTVPQNDPTMDAAMKMIERLVLAKKLQHDGNPAMSWMIGNVAVKRNERTGEMFPVKAGGKDSFNKIDGPVALFNAMSQMVLAQPEPQPEYAMYIFGGR